MQVLSGATFEQVLDALRGVDGRYILRDRETSPWSISIGMAGQIAVQVGHEGGANIYDGTARGDAHILYLPLGDPELIRWAGDDLDRTSLAGTHAAGASIVRKRAANNGMMLALPVDMFRRTERFEGKDLAVLERLNGALQVDPSRLASLRLIAERLVSLEAPLSAAAGQAAEDELMAHIFAAIGSRTTSPNPTRGRLWVSRKAILRKVRDLIGSSEKEVLHVEDLCRAAGVSERTLRVVFQETFGLGPIRYLRHRRLHLVRAALRTADPSRETVARVAAEFGFWEFGRFAQDYKRLFGELPSQTLNRTKPNVRHDGIVLDRAGTLTRHGLR